MAYDLVWISTRLLRGVEILAGEYNPGNKSSRIAFSSNVVGLFRAMRGGRVLGIIACGADACVRSTWRVMGKNHGTGRRGA
jgi:hypothetical protein